MTRFSKVLVLAGAAAMILSPMAAGAMGSALPVLSQATAQSDDDDDDHGLGALEIGGIVLALAAGGMLLGGGSGGGSGGGAANPQSN